MNKTQKIDNCVKLIRKELRLLRKFNAGYKELLEEIKSVKAEINNNYSPEEINLARDKILVMAICPRGVYRNGGVDEMS